MQNATSPHIRPAQPSDVDGIFLVRLAAHGNALTMTEMAAIGITRDSVTEMINAAPCAWVACLDEHIIGFSMIDADEGALFAAFVLPSYEGKGIGKKLVQVAEQSLFSQHAVAWLETAKSSRAAGFYRHLGWAHEQDIGNGDIRLEKRTS